MGVGGALGEWWGEGAKEQGGGEGESEFNVAQKERERERERERESRLTTSISQSVCHHRLR